MYVAWHSLVPWEGTEAWGVVSGISCVGPMRTARDSSLGLHRLHAGDLKCAWGQMLPSLEFHTA